MLASDPNSKSSAAALDIKIGSFHDPVHLQGRVCERMSCKSWSLLQREKRIVIYYVKKLVRKSQ
jgi:hypothetical protein